VKTDAEVKETSAKTMMLTVTIFRNVLKGLFLRFDMPVEIALKKASARDISAKWVPKILLRMCLAYLDTLVIIIDTTSMLIIITARPSILAKRFEASRKPGCRIEAIRMKHAAIMIIFMKRFMPIDGNTICSKIKANGTISKLNRIDVLIRSCCVPLISLYAFASKFQAIIK
jgi:hypothetical protein